MPLYLTKFNVQIPQSTEGRHWFSYVDPSVTMELLKKLTDEFIIIYEKSPARLKSKLNSIKALAQCAGNRNQNTQTKKDQEWKPSDMMNMYPDGTLSTQLDQGIDDDPLFDEQSTEQSQQPQQSQEQQKEQQQDEQSQQQQQEEQSNQQQQEEQSQSLGNEAQKKQLQSMMLLIEPKTVQVVSQQQQSSNQQQQMFQSQNNLQSTIQNSTMSNAVNQSQNVMNICRKPDPTLANQHRSYQNQSSAASISTCVATSLPSSHNQQEVNIPSAEVILGKNFIHLCAFKYHYYRNSYLAACALQLVHDFLVVS